MPIKFVSSGLIKPQSRDGKMSKYLYFEPRIYMPYAISLRKKNAISLDEMWVEHGEVIDLAKHCPKPKRETNGNFIRIEFNKPLYMDVESLNGIDEVVTFVMKYTVRFDSDNTEKIVHRQHIAVRGDSSPHSTVSHYTTRYAAPAIFGLAGKDSISDNGLFYGESKVMQFGLTAEDKKTWAIETLDKLYPNTELLHGALH